MDLKRLRYFCSVVEHGSVTKAAGALHMAQPPLSKRLRELEEEVGAELFVRCGRTIQPTAAGYHLYQRAGKILREVDEAAKETATIAAKQSRILRVGLTHLYQTYFSRMLLELHRAYPNIELVITVSDSGHLERLLRAGLIDIALMQHPLDSADLECIDLPPVKVVAIASSKLALDKTRECITQTELGQYPLILLKRAYGKGIFENLSEHFRKAGIAPHVRMCVSQPEIILAWMEGGLEAVALLPASEVRSGRLLNCRMLQIANAPLVFFPTVVKLTTANYPPELTGILENAEHLISA